MPFLRFESGPDKGVTCPIRSKRVSMGRSPDNDIIVHDDTASSFHAAISFLNQAYFIEDLGSINGTFVNEIKIHRKRLRDSDEIVIGKTLLTYLESTVSSEGEGFDIRGKNSKELLTDFVPETPLPGSIETLKRAHENLRRVYEISSIISSIFDTKELSGKILDIIFPLFDADRGYIMLVDGEGDRLRLVASKKRGDKGKDADEIAFSRTIARRVLDREESVITSNAPEDSRFPQKESILNGHIKSAMCVPIRGRKEKLGFIYVDHRGEAGHFTDDQLQLLTMVANSAGIAIENILLYEENLKMNVLKAVNEEMRETNLRLLELEASKEDLINMVVHDMKNPVSNTMMGLDMIALDPDARLADQQNEYLQLAKRNQFKLSEMITNLLEISRLESGALEINKVTIDVGELIDRTVERYAATMKAEDKSVSVSVDPAARLLAADERLLDRILSNILSNAIKHSHPKGEIHIHVAENNGGVSISVRDRGEGIPKEYHEKIFEKFCQAGLRKLGHKTDTGLGLAFCKMAVEAHGGTIGVESEPDKGSCFTFTLPGALRQE